MVPLKDERRSRNVSNFHDTRLQNNRSSGADSQDRNVIVFSCLLVVRVDVDDDDLMEGASTESVGRADSRLPLGCVVDTENCFTKYKNIR